jgi:aryl-alcohol dehydrogenase-like predicted oxidoreductase
MLFGRETAETEARHIVDDAAERGVNFIDTADAYAAGASEEVVGRAIKDRRQQWVLATKVANPMGPGPNHRGLSRLHVVRAVEASLRRLGTDHIDLYYTHKVDPRVPWDEVAMTFGDLVRTGKIRYWGISNVRGWHIADICHTCRHLGVAQPVALQPYYNLMMRQPEVELLPAAQHFGLGVVTYSPVARGVLTGKYQLNVTPGADTRVGRKDKRMLDTEWRPESLAIAGKLKAHAESRGVSLLHWAVAWVLNNSSVTSAIVGPRTFEQWQSYLGALDYRWTAEDEALADSLVSPGHPSTPGYNDPQYPIEGRFPSVAAKAGEA